MCKRYGQETKEIDEKAGSEQGTKSEPAENNEDSQNDQDLEFPALIGGRPRQIGDDKEMKRWAKDRARKRKKSKK
jgi:hypothetical protein